MTSTSHNPFGKVHAFLLSSKAWTLVIVVTATVLYTGIFTKNAVTDMIGLAGFDVIVLASYLTATTRVDK